MGAPTGIPARLGCGLVVAVLVSVFIGGCAGTAGDAETPTASPSASPSGESPDTEPSPSGPSPSEETQPEETQPQRPVRFEQGRAMADVRRLADGIGPRLATGPAFREAAAVVERRLAGHGYQVERDPFDVPAGDSWGVPVEAGRSFNLVATPAGFDAGSPYRLVGAHLDTVAVAPGAEDNASGVAVLLELARLASAAGTALPTVLVAFGAEEPRGPGDDMHHFGSQHYVREMAPAERRGLRAMVAVDRVGVGATMPVCTGGLSDPRVREQLVAAADRAGAAALDCTTTGDAEDPASDHWSFEKAGFAVGRLGSTPYAGYHSAADTADAIVPDQLGRAGRITWEWLRAR